MVYRNLVCEEVATYIHSGRYERGVVAESIIRGSR